MSIIYGEKGFLVIGRSTLHILDWLGFLSIQLCSRWCALKKPVSPTCFLLESQSQSSCFTFRSWPILPRPFSSLNYWKWLTRWFYWCALTYHCFLCILASWAQASCPSGPLHALPSCCPLVLGQGPPLGLLPIEALVGAILMICSHPNLYYWVLSFSRAGQCRLLHISSM